MKRANWPSWRVAVVALTALLAAGCAGQGNERFASLAQSGTAFTEQAPLVYDYAFQQAFDRNSQDLVRNRERLRTLSQTAGQADEVKASLQKEYDEDIDAFQERLASFQVMKRHAATLREYFVTLNTLASPGGAEAAGTAADGLGKELSGLVPAVKRISLGGKRLETFIGPLTELAVASFVNVRLQRHLKTHAATVQQAIALQRAMFALLLEIESDRTKIGVEAKIRQAFLNLNEELPDDWIDQRRQALRFQLQPNPISAALDAAVALESSFSELVEGGQGSLDRLERAIVFAESVVAVFKTTPEGASQ